jgi:peroxiredoxin
MTDDRRAMPAVGAPAPEFRLPGADGTEIALADYRGTRHLVLWFSKGLF